MRAFGRRRARRPRPIPTVARAADLREQRHDLHCRVAHCGAGDHDAVARFQRPLREYLGAYTPQEVKLPLGGWTRGVELVDVVSSEPQRIEYVVKDATSEARKLGELTVGDSSALLVTESTLRDMP